VHDTWVHPIMVTGDSITIDGNHVYNGILSNVNGSRIVQFWPGGISTWSRSSGAWSTNIVIRNNHVHDTWGEGILPVRSNGVTIADNKVHDTYSVNIYLTEVRRAVVERNYVYSSNPAFNRNGRPADGIFIANEGSATGGSPNAAFSNDMLIRNNVVAKTGYGIWFWYDASRTTNNSYANVRILNNVVKDTALANVRFMDVPSSQTQPAGNVLRNNVLYGAVQLDDAGGWVRTNNWAVPTQGDPKLVSPVAGGAKEGFRVQTGSPLIRAGVASAEVATDMWGAARSSTPTIGVHEG
jgi:parallel beta-helix repeat protein